MIDKVEGAYLVLDVVTILAGITYTFASTYPVDPLVLCAMTVSVLSMVCCCVPRNKKKISLATTALLKTVVFAWGLHAGLSSSCDDCPWDITAALITGLSCFVYGGSAILTIAQLVRIMICSGHATITEEGD